jgi:hypothetical protein
MLEKEKIVVPLQTYHFWDEVVVDLVLHTPAMHIKKRAEDDIKNNFEKCLLMLKSKSIAR